MHTTLDTDAHAETFEAVRRDAEAWMTLGALRDALAQYEAHLPLVDDLEPRAGCSCAYATSCLSSPLRQAAIGRAD